MPGQAPLPTLSHGLPALLSRQLLAVARIEASLAMRMVDIGPAADDKTGAAERFRSFWGPKAELRRFQDGKISEAVVWECPPSDRHIIPDKIVAYVLSMRHLLHKAPPLPHSSPSSAPREISASISTTCSCLDASLLQLPPGTSGAKSTALGSRGGSATILDPSHGVSSQRLIESALEALGKQLRSTEGLALKVVGVQPVGAAARQTCTFVPSPHPLATAGVGSGGLGRFSGGKIPRCMEPIEVLVQLESSGEMRGGRGREGMFDCVSCLDLLERRGR